tara:strand:- start:811 stop:966 length:156 start_codon:yes stop_codon:yes gene_type:complete
MKTIKLRGKTWKQITPEEFKELKGYKTAIFKDTFYEEYTYFKLIEKNEKRI